MEQREKVTFYMGQPVGPTSQSVCNLTSFLGTLGRNKRVVNLCYTSWVAVPPEKKKFTWDYTNAKFILPENTEKWVVQSVRDAWKRFKGKIKQKHFLPYDNVEDMVKNRPMQVPPSEFIRLMLYWSHPLIETISEKNKEHSRQQKYPHRMAQSISQECEQPCAKHMELMKSQRGLKYSSLHAQIEKGKNLMRQLNMLLMSLKAGKLLERQKRKLSSPYLGKNN
ncbi:hypothetical protein PIB30_084400 [Stylosanthes scabra]|uniref:Uncharacterized protein n=1 Tax=Stylosanthes scabra TaxID=79078 RepID=A0ABU6TT41_9FABA|nr:hypothetical protein [Stylosanthes scabra]